jgi:hypothetical protein
MGRVEAAVAELDLVVWVPIERNDPVGCPEEELPELKEAVNTLLNEMITDFNVPVLEVTGSVAQRVQQVLKYMRERTARP